MTKALKPGALFGLHMFYYACAELLINDLATARVGTENVVVLYGAISVAVAVGFLLFPFLRRLLKSGMSRKLSLAVAWALNIVAFAAVLSTPNPALFSAAAALVSLTAGYIGGFVFYSIAVGALDKAYYGRVFGFSSAAAFCAQYGFSKLLAVLGDGGILFEAILLGAVISSCAVSLLFFSGRPQIWTIKSGSAITDRTDMKKYLWGAFFIIAVIWAMEGALDGVVTGLHANQTLNVSELPRLLHAVGLVIAGFVFDFKEGRFYAPVTVLFMIAQIIAVFFFTSADGFNVALGAIYLCGAFGSVYSQAELTLSAASSPSPALWAVMGRAAKYIPNGIMAVAGGYFYTSNANITFALLYLVLLGALFTLFFTQGKLSVERDDPAEYEPSRPSAPTMEKLIADYGLTSREAEVLRMLLTGKKTADIAEALCVTEGTVYKYISSMIKKTKTNNRLELIATFSDTRP
jgi:DNA-binding NarL/FixJ family response regulator